MQGAVRKRFRIPIDRWSIITLAALLPVYVVLYRYHPLYFLFVAPFVEIFIDVIVRSILSIRAKHPGEVYTLWLVFFFVSSLGAIIYLYLDANNLLIVQSDSFTQIDESKKMDLISRAMSIYVEANTKIVGEIEFISVLFLLIVLPQVLSFLISGLFGCGKPPSYVLKVTRLSVLSLVKFFCGFAGLLFAELFFKFYKLGAVVIDAFIINIYLLSVLALLSAAFFLESFYYSLSEVIDIIARSVQMHWLRNGAGYMTKYTSELYEHNKSMEEGVSAWDALRILLRKGLVMTDQKANPEDAALQQALAIILHNGLFMTYAGEFAVDVAYFVRNGMSEEQADKAMNTIMGFLKEQRFRDKPA